MEKEKYKEFFRYANERNAIYIKRKNGDLAPWTKDPILQEYRFCNVYRELDSTTKWFRENIRDPLSESPEVLFATVAFRWFNKIETGTAIKEQLLAGPDKWDPVKIHNLLAHKKPIVTGAYIIKTPDGMNKLKGVLWCIEQIRKECNEIAEVCMINERIGQEDLWNELRKYPYLGDFMSYEIVTDLAHTCVLENATDLNTWANPGPGAMRGYARILGKPPESLSRNNKDDRALVIKGMQEIIKLAPEFGFDGTSLDYPIWTMREAEHTLCETDKYLRVKNGEGRPKQKYRPAT